VDDDDDDSREDEDSPVKDNSKEESQGVSKHI
jgi:hypothetical protein